MTEKELTRTQKKQVVTIYQSTKIEWAKEKINKIQLNKEIIRNKEVRRKEEREEEKRARNITQSKNVKFYFIILFFVSPILHV